MTPAPEATKKPSTVGTRIAADLSDMAVIVAQERSQSVAEVLDPIIREPLTELYREACRKLAARVSPNDVGGEG